MADEDLMKIASPLWAVSGVNVCWKCGKSEKVVCLAAERVQMEPDSTDWYDEFVLLTNIAGLPAEILSFLKQINPLFTERFSQTVGSSYLANGCGKCGALFGDHFLHDVDGPFFPQTEEEAGSLTITQLPIQGEWPIDASCCMGAPEMILTNAKRATTSNCPDSRT